MITNVTAIHKRKLEVVVNNLSLLLPLTYTHDCLYYKHDIHGIRV